MKYYLLFLALLTWPFTVSAQDEEEADDSPTHRLFEGRIITGLNFTQIMGDNHGGFHKVGANVGGMVYVHYKEVLGLSFEMLYTQKGVRSANVKESVTLGTYFDKYFLNLDYVEACLMLHLDCFILDYEAGISYARLVKSQEWAEADVPIVIDQSLAAFNAHDFNKFAFPVFYGAHQATRAGVPQV